MPAFSLGGIQSTSVPRQKISKLLVNEIDPTKPEHKSAIKYISYWLKKNSDKGSAFDRKTWWIRWLPGLFLIKLLLHFDYDGLLLYADDGKTIVGHIFFQKHPLFLPGVPGWHVFSVSIDLELRRHGKATAMVIDLLKLAWVQQISYVKLGGGSHEKMAGIAAKIVQQSASLPFEFYLRGTSTIEFV